MDLLLAKLSYLLSFSVQSKNRIKGLYVPIYVLYAKQSLRASKSMHYMQRLWCDSGVQRSVSDWMQMLWMMKKCEQIFEGTHFSFIFPSNFAFRTRNWWISNFIWPHSKCYFKHAQRSALLRLQYPFILIKIHPGRFTLQYQLALKEKQQVSHFHNLTVANHP